VAAETSTPGTDATIPWLSLGVATVLGVGYMPVAPGTFGSLVGLLIWPLLPRSAAVQAAVILVLLAAGSAAGTVAERYYERRDPRQVVLDEVMGMLITLYLVPVGWLAAVVGFLFFRLADVVKPFPANRFEALPGGLGVMADDGMAGVYAALALRIVLAFVG
jgi:phosphatidylglycerophosphatase A